MTTGQIIQKRLQVAAVAVLLFGGFAASMIYWRGAGLTTDSIDDPNSTDFKNPSRGTEMYYGKTGLLWQEIQNTFSRPGPQAALIAGTSVLLAAVFRLAGSWLGKTPTGAPRN